MRLVVTPGEKFSKYICPFCGQVELLTEGEQPVCQNCGSEMELFVEKPSVEEQESPEIVEMPPVEVQTDEVVL